MRMDDFYGFKTGRLENDLLALDYLTEAGPRVVRLIPKSLDENLLAEIPDAELPSPHGPYRLLGGHRMWHAPETSARTYIPDHEGLTMRLVQDGVLLMRDEAFTGIRKEMIVRLHPTAMDVQLYHRFTNTGLWPKELAPWAITQMAIGGTAVLPQNSAALDPEGLLANRHLVLWQYTDWADPRLKLGNETIQVAAQDMEKPLKIGYFNRAGWLEYAVKGLTFRKEFVPQPDRVHPDMGCNAEVYTNNLSIELETLGPLVTLQPGETVEHFERWVIA